MGVRMQEAVHQRWGSAIRGAERAVLNYLAFRANEQTGWCWPTVETIAREAGYSDRAVQLALPRLARRGAIAIEAGSGHHGAHRFRLLFADTANDGSGDVDRGVKPVHPSDGCATEGGEAASPRGELASPGGETGAPGVNWLHPRGELASPKQIENRHREPEEEPAPTGTGRALARARGGDGQPTARFDGRPGDAGDGRSQTRGRQVALPGLAAVGVGQPRRAPNRHEAPRHVIEDERLAWLRQLGKAAAG